MPTLRRAAGVPRREHWPGGAVPALRTTNGTHAGDTATGTLGPATGNRVDAADGRAAGGWANCDSGAIEAGREARRRATAQGCCRRSAEHEPPFGGGFRRERQQTLARLHGSPSGQSSRKAIAMGRRAPRMAGNSPPIRPISTAHTIPRTNSSGVTANAKVTWLKLCQFMVAASMPLKAK
jgi:hypothetical protein